MGSNSVYESNNNETKNEQNTSGQKTIIAILIIIIVLLLFFCVSMTYAYMNKEVEHKEIKKVVLKEGSNFSIIINNNETSTDNKVIIKTFEITNDNISTESILNLDLNDLIEAYNHDSSIYTLSYSKTENGTYQDITINKKLSEATMERLVIPAGETYYYKLKVILN